jgi:hypothetical protein
MAWTLYSDEPIARLGDALCEREAVGASDLIGDELRGSTQRNVRGWKMLVQ